MAVRLLQDTLNIFYLNYLSIWAKRIHQDMPN